MGVPFIKMHGLGNDFVVLDGREAPLAIGETQARAIADRHEGVGCDQVILIEKAQNNGADVFMRIRNSDGGEVAACGNATRCVASMIMTETESSHAVIETAAGMLRAEEAPGGHLAVDMGEALLDWKDIPLSEERDTLHLEIGEGPLQDPVGVSMGNPHAVFFVDDVESVPLDTLGPVLEHHGLFPERANIGVAQVRDPGLIRLRVWERGAGITQACGTGACAALVAANRRGLAGRAADVTLDGGTLRIELLEDNHVRMTGPVAVSFIGTLSDELIA